MTVLESPTRKREYMLRICQFQFDVGHNRMTSFVRLAEVPVRECGDDHDEHGGEYGSENPESDIEDVEFVFTSECFPDLDDEGRRDPGDDELPTSLGMPTGVASTPQPGPVWSDNSLRRSITGTEDADWLEVAVDGPDRPRGLDEPWEHRGTDCPSIGRFPHVPMEAERLTVHSDPSRRTGPSCAGDSPPVENHASGGREESALRPAGDPGVPQPPVEVPVAAANDPQAGGESMEESAQPPHHDSDSAGPERFEPEPLAPQPCDGSEGAPAEPRQHPDDKDAPVPFPSETPVGTERGASLADLRGPLEAAIGALEGPCASIEEIGKTLRDIKDLLDEHVPGRVANEALEHARLRFADAEAALQGVGSAIQQYMEQIGLSPVEDPGDPPKPQASETSSFAKAIQGPSRVGLSEAAEKTQGPDAADARAEQAAVGDIQEHVGVILAGMIGLTRDDAYRRALSEWANDRERGTITDRQQLRQRHPLVARFLDALDDLVLDVRDLLVDGVAASGKDLAGTAIPDHGATPTDRPAGDAADRDAKAEHRREVNQLVTAARGPAHAAQRDAIKQRIRGLGRLDTEARMTAAQDIRASAISMLDDVLQTQGRRDAYREAFSGWTNDPERGTIGDRQQLHQHHPLVARFLDALDDLLVDILVEVAKEMLFEMLLPGIHIIIPPTDFVGSVFTALTMMKIADGAA
ncbi:MAG: hypothetical protein JXA67_15845 [Micromonosporaceae bacterium]|nr:hypothetical protein [Micromonosporaceae bacterium]